MANEVNYGRIAIIPRGDFAGDVQYDVGDVVSYDGSSYLAFSKPPLATLPTDTNYWQVSAQGGASLATTETAGLVKPDGETITIAEDGTIACELTASQVGALKIYTNLAELGLAEATATAEDIVTAMADNSMLLHTLSATATTSTLAFPYNYSLLVVTKRNKSYTRFECVGTGTAGLIYYGYYNGGATTKWSGWSTKFLPLTGGTLSGNVSIQGGYTRITGDASQTQINALNVQQDTSNRRLLVIRNSTNQPQIASAFQVMNVVDNNVTAYRVFGEHNKPTGTYTGNGDATTRTIDTGGIGHAIMVYGNGYSFFIGRYGGFGIQNGKTSLIADGITMFFTNGNLTLSENTILNVSGVIYYYQVL